MNDETERSFKDDLLERALEHRRVGEPRPGLEGRVLARLQAAGRPGRSPWFRFGVVAVPAAVVILAVVYLVYSPASRPPVEEQPPRIVQVAPPVADDSSKATAGVAESPPPSPPVRTPPVAERVQPEITPEVEPAGSRSPMFPAPRALSPQEAQLVRFVRSARLETLRSASEQPFAGPVQIEELSTPPLHVEPLQAADPLAAS